jgi:dephospho-CoA kinase
MIVVGLTGGIASGKSTVSRMLSELGGEIIDADGLAREAVARDTPAFAGIVAHFGPGILQADGAIDRKRLGDIVFSDPRQRKRLEEIVHPFVKEETGRRIEQIRRRRPQAVVFLDVPLLFESGMHLRPGLAEIIVVHVPESLQVRRLVARDGITAEQARARIRAQMPLARKKRLATRLIDNSGSLENTRSQAAAVFRALADRAQQAGDAGGL